jgi:hypothetical protein
MADSVPITLPFKQKDLARRTVLAAFVAPLMLPKVRDTLQVLSQDVRPPQSPTVLPFVKDTDKAARASGAAPRCFWSVTPTGHFGTDCVAGAKYGALALDYMATNRTPYLFQWSVIDMMSMGRAHSGLEIGFLSAFGRAASTAYARTLFEGGAA